MIIVVGVFLINVLFFMTITSYFILASSNGVQDRLFRGDFSKLVGTYPFQKCRDFTVAFMISGERNWLWP